MSEFRKSGMHALDTLSIFHYSVVDRTSVYRRRASTLVLVYFFTMCVFSVLMFVWECIFVVRSTSAC